MTIAEQALVQVRLDKKLRDQASEIYSELGLDIPTAIRMFFKRTVAERGIPFELMLSDEDKKIRENALKAAACIQEKAERDGVSNMTLDEINAEIEAARREREQRNEENLRDNRY